MNRQAKGPSTTIANYWCHVVGESPQRVAGFHASTVQRTKAYALAIHIPVLTWCVTGFVIARHVFALDTQYALSASLLCGGLIYLIERLVLSAPKSMLLNAVRVLMGLVIAFLGAATVDLVVFDREIVQQLNRAAFEQLAAEHDAKLAAHAKLVDQRKSDWLRGQQAANCEANGTCGSKVRSVGPVYRELARQADFLRQEYLATQAQSQALDHDKALALARLRANPPSPSEAGLLARLQALHDYVTQNRAAFVAWGLLFSLVLFLELVVIFTKMAFGKTVDDEIEELRETISRHKAQEYVNTMLSPVTRAQNMLAQTL